MKFLIISLLAFFIAGCSASSSSIVQNRDKHYLTAKSVPPLRIPPNVTTTAFHTDYPVAYRTYTDAQKEVSLVPPGLNH